MPAKVFIDTSVLVYLYSEDEPAKAQQALLLGERYGCSYFNCLMLASALELGCDVIYSEDMQHGQKVENFLETLNPFVE